MAYILALDRRAVGNPKGVLMEEDLCTWLVEQEPRIQSAVVAYHINWGDDNMQGLKVKWEADDERSLFIMGEAHRNLLEDESVWPWLLSGIRKRAGVAQEAEVRP